MKGFHIILAIYLMLLSFAPCSDALECHDVNGTEIAAADTHQSHSHELELCSPMCGCVCCGQFAEPEYQLAALPKPTPPAEPLHSNYQDRLPSGVHLAIWLPPKIS